jgi:phosphoglycerol transferase MdoB-like AlkP superfamily enzyme
MQRLYKSIYFLAISLLIFSLARAALLAAYPGQFESLDISDTFYAFFHGLRFDASILAKLIGVPLLLMMIPLRFANNRWWFDSFAWIIYVVLVAASLLLLIDLVYYQFVSRHMGNELLLLKDDMDFGISVAFGPYKWFMFALLLYALGLAWLWRKILRIPNLLENKYAYNPDNSADNKYKAVLINWAGYSAIFFLLVLAGRGAIINRPINVIDAFTKGDTSYGNLVLNGVFTTAHATFRSKSIKHRFMKPDKALNIIRDQTGADPQYPMVRSHPYKPTGRNLVIVVLESWDPLYVDSFRRNQDGAPITKPRNATPVFDALAEKSLKFTNFYASGQRSIESTQSVLTGLPVVAGMPVLGNGLEVSNVTRLGNIARNNGYEAIMVRSAERHVYRMNSVAAALGFDRYYGSNDMPMLLDYPDPKAARFGWDYETFMYFKSQLDQSEKPFLAIMYTGTAHYPLPKKLGKQFETRPHTASQVNTLLNTLQYTDWSMGEFLKAAEKSPWFDNTVFLFYADHTWGQQNKKGSFVEKFRIPLLIYAPKIFEPRIRTTVSSQLDLLPTFM